MRRRLALAQVDEHVDLVPLIDCVFLILLFFMLVGHLSDRTEDGITVPPGKTAVHITDLDGWTREVLRVDRRVRLGSHSFAPDPAGWTALRCLLDQVHARAAKDHDQSPLVVVEIRADSDAATRTVQELQQILADAVDPATSLPRPSTAPRHAFTHLEFTAHSPE